MASSGDEFASYDQSPRVRIPAASNLVAGPSKSDKRKKAQEFADETNDEPNPMEAIAISSDEEEPQPVNVRRRRAATGTGATNASAPNGRSVSSKGKGKAPANAPNKRRKIGDANEVSGVEETAAETDGDAGLSRREKTWPVSGDTKGKKQGPLQRQIERLEKQVEDVVQQRDRVSDQLAELFRLRQTEPERLLTEHKAQYDARFKAQDDTIQELQSSLARADALSQNGGTTSLHFLTRETADEEKQDVQREVMKLKKTIKEKDVLVGDKDAKIRELDDTIQQLRADLKAEIENTKALTSRNPPSSGSKHTSKSGDWKLAMVIRLYEELTGTLITNVKHEPGEYKEDDAIYTCVQTTNNKSLNFTLKFFRELEEGESPSSVRRDERTVEKVIYTPQWLDREAEEFVTQLDFLAGPFTFQKSQMRVFMKTLTSYLEGENQDHHSDEDRMEDEDV